MQDSHSSLIPADPNTILQKSQSKNEVTFPYREAVGSLMYLSVGSRPDICFAVNKASRYVENPSQIHVNAVKKILKYVKATIGYGILYKNNININLFGYSDADYANDIDTRCSTSGYIFLINCGIISWASEKQRTVAQAITESEYIAGSQAVKELVWLSRLLDELLPKKIDVPIFNMDNQSAIKLVKNPEYHKRTKHIDIRYHFIRQKYEEKLFQLKFVPTNAQLADILTKALCKEKFVKLRNEIGILNSN